jgi:cytochrome d ubiquinol oxidase subunit II
LTIVGSASHRYTLEVMSWVALIFTPLVLLYQGWTYWIFKKRVGRPSATTEPVPTNV